MNLCPVLAGLGAEVTAFGRNLPPKALDARVEWRSGDLADSAAIAAALAGQDVLFHLASGSVPGSSNEAPPAELSGTPLATAHLLEACVKAGIRKVVFASSGGAVYGIPRETPIPETAATDPIVAYGIGKLVIEKYLQLYRHLHGLDYHILRIANPYGRFQLGKREQGLVGTLIRRAALGQPVEIWGDGDIVRDFIHVDDVSSAFVAAVGYGGPRKIMNVGSGVGRSVMAVVEDVERALGKGPIPRIHRAGRRADVPINVLDTGVIRSETGWRPEVDWDHGLRDTVAWMFDQDAHNATPV